MMKRFAPLRRAPAAFLLCGTLALAACDESGPPRPGEAASEFAVLAPDGSQVRLEDYRGKVVLLNFWLGGCGPCLQEMPKLDAYYRANRDRGFAVLALNMGQPEATVAEIARRLGVSFPLLSDTLKITAERYQVVAVPTSFVIGRDGRLVEKFLGPFSDELLAEKIGRRL